MEPLNRLRLFNPNAGLEADGEHECRPVIGGKELDSFPITEAALPNGKKVKLLKTMVTSACERNCYYCPFRAGRDMRRATFTPDELAKTYMKLFEAKAVEGLFLSSGIIKGGVTTQDKIIAAAEILRKKYGYRGYIHAKLMPGVEKDQVETLMTLASRVSLNLEAPNDNRLQKLAPKKSFLNELLQPLLWVEDIRRTKSPQRTWNGRWPSSATQFVVGAVGESDLELIQTSEALFKRAGLTRIYYSGFNPIADTPLESHPPEDPWRQHRLYQSSYLLRDYGFTLEELPFDQTGNLSKSIDPKLAWAQQHLAHAPIEINTAPKETLLRIPGIGATLAEKILAARRTRKLNSLRQLKTLGVYTARSAPFILLDGKRPSYQLNLIG